MCQKESELSTSRYRRRPESRRLTLPGSEDGLAQGVKQTCDDKTDLHHEGRVGRRNKGASRRQEHNMHGPKFRKDTEWRNVWLEQKPLERKREMRSERLASIEFWRPYTMLKFIPKTMENYWGAFRRGVIWQDFHFRKIPGYNTKNIGGWQKRHRGSFRRVLQEFRKKWWPGLR